MPALTERDLIWNRTHAVDGEVVARFGRRGQELVMEWPDIARLQCSPDGRRARITRFPNADDGRFAKLRGPIRALVGDLRGGLGLHASAVAIGPKAVLILGDSGAGKSTTACELAMSHGARLLADDAALVVVRRGIPYVEPTEAVHCLWPDASKHLGAAPEKDIAYHDKVFVRPPHVARVHVKLALVVALRFDDDAAAGVGTTRLSGSSAAAYVLRSMFRVDDGAIELRRLDLLQRIHARVPFIELSRSHDEPSVTTQILQHLASAK
nr:hypothetical protein Hi04_10k_c3883_00009 [uncultured bacterium]